MPKPKTNKPHSVKLFELGLSCHEAVLAYQYCVSPTTAYYWYINAFIIARGTEAFLKSILAKKEEEKGVPDKEICGILQKLGHNISNLFQEVNQNGRLNSIEEYIQTINNYKFEKGLYPENIDSFEKKGLKKVFKIEHLYEIAHAIGEQLGIWNNYYVSQYNFNKQMYIATYKQPQEPYA